MMQLDLFDWTSPPEHPMELAPTSAGAPTGGAIICFPQRRNVGKARHVAALILKRREGRDRDSYWQQVCTRMAGTLSRAGLDDVEINRQIWGFSEAVTVEISRINASDRQQPGGTA